MIVVGITGTTSGIGKAIADVLEEEDGFEVIHFNRKDGYDIDDSASRFATSTVAYNQCNIFVNNAYGSNPYSQLEMLYSVVDSSVDIINISSINSTNLTPSGMTQSRYAVSKSSQDMAMKHFKHFYPGNKYCTINLGLSDTSYNEHKTEPKLSPTFVAEEILHIIKGGIKIESTTIIPT